MWKDVTINKYYELHTITKMVKDPVELNIRLLACYKGVDYKAIERLTVRQLTKELQAIAFLKELPSETKLQTTFRLRGNIYKAIILTEQLTSGQFIDFASIGKDEKPEDTIYHIHELLGAMCMKRKWITKLPFLTYEYEGWEKTAAVFHDHMTMDIAYPFYLFFCNVLKNLQQPMVDYSLKIANKEIEKMKKLIKESV